MTNWSSNLPIKEQELYWSESEVQRVIDGDTIEVLSILPFKAARIKLSLRLQDLFCFETRKPSNDILDALTPHMKAIGVESRLELIDKMKALGNEAKAAMEHLVMGERLLVYSFKTSFDRYVAKVWRTRDGLNLVDWMIQNNYGQEEDPKDQAYPYGKLLEHHNNLIHDK